MMYRRRPRVVRPFALVLCIAVSAALAQALAQTGGLSPTPSTGAGPEFLPDAPYTATFWRDGDPGERLMLSGRIMDTSGRPVAGAVVDLWQADGAGNYHDDAYRGRLVTDEGGRYAVRTVVPASYYRARHIHMMVSHDSHGTVTTRVEFKGDPALEGRDDSHAIVLEETHVEDDVVYVGTFDVVLPGS